MNVDDLIVLYMKQEADVPGTVIPSEGKGRDAGMTSITTALGRLQDSVTGYL
jgi:hypothetical protein